MKLLYLRAAFCRVLIEDNAFHGTERGFGSAPSPATARRPDRADRSVFERGAPHLPSIRRHDALPVDDDPLGKLPAGATAPYTGADTTLGRGGPKSYSSECVSVSSSRRKRTLSAGDSASTLIRFMTDMYSSTSRCLSKYKELVSCSV